MASSFRRHGIEEPSEAGEHASFNSMHRAQQWKTLLHRALCMTGTDVKKPASTAL